MRVLLHTPLKPPDSPTPSGDREMARGLLRLLRRLGHTVLMPPLSRVAPGVPAPEAHLGLERCARRQAARLIARWQTLSPNHPERFDLWFTYHCYHKAPDHLGPAVADAFGIPFVVADASVAPKQAAGPWADGYAAANAAIRRADRVIAFDPLDIPCVAAIRAGKADVVAMPPLADRPPCDAGGRAGARRDLAAALDLDPDTPWLITVAMMRPGAKGASYRLLADALRRLEERRWALLIAGDGPARPEVEAAFAGIGPVRFLSRLGQAAVHRLHAAADLAVWPALGEAYCMALVEAQAAGVPVVAGMRRGIATVVEDGKTGLLTPEGDEDAFARAVAALLGDPARRRAIAAAAGAAAQRYDLSAAARRLDDVLRALR